MSDDFVVNVKQILQYPEQTSVLPLDGFLLQTGGVGGPYKFATPLDIFGTSLLLGGFIRLAPVSGGLAWNGATLTYEPGQFVFSEPVTAPDFFVDGSSVVTWDELEALPLVSSFNGREGRVLLELNDILRAGGAPILNPHLLGWATSTEPFSPDVDDTSIATCHWVHRAFAHDALYCGVASFNGRHGNILLTDDDITFACTQPGAQPRTNTPPSGDASSRIASTAFVDDGLDDLKLYLDQQLQGLPTDAEMALFAPINSPQFTGIPTGPTAAPGSNTGQLATTAFVEAAVVASTTGVATFNGRSGTVVLNTADVVAAGGAPLNSPALTGAPTAPTQTPGDNTTRIATTAFVEAALSSAVAGVASFNTRTGAVTLQAADVTAVGGALLASPTFTGVPKAPTAVPADSSTALATTAFVHAAIAAISTGVASFNSRTGVVTLQASDISAAGGALLVSPNFTGNPTAPTAAPGDSDTTIATTAFVANAVASGIAGVSSFNTRTGAVTLSAADVTGAGGALILSPTFLGVPAAPTATAGTNSTQLATTAFVQGALAAAPGGVSSFMSRTGAITLLAADISAAGGALLASPAFSGNPTAPTPAPGDSDTSIATTAFVANALISAGGVSSFNGRAGAVTLNATDIQSASGAVYRQSDTAPAVTPNTLWYDSIHGQLYVQYKDPSTNALSWVIANNPPPPPQIPGPTTGSRVLLATQTISTPVAAVNFFGSHIGDGTYNEYELRAYDLLPATEQAVTLRFSTDGSTFDTGATNYGYTFHSDAGNNTTAGGGGASSGILMGQTMAITAALPFYAAFDIYVSPVAYTSVRWRGVWQATTLGALNCSGAGIYSGGGVNAAIKGFQIAMGGAANLTRGTFKLYGVVK